MKIRLTRRRLRLCSLAFVMASFGCSDQAPSIPKSTEGAIFSVCVFGKGYWKTHPTAWPSWSLMLGSARYSEGEILSILELPVGGDASILLAHHLVAASLNTASGVATPSSVQRSMNDAQAWMSRHADADGRLPYGIAPRTAAGRAATSLAAALEGFNSGNAGVPACGRDCALTPEACACVPTTCEALESIGGDYCGVLTDGCGASIDCGGCASPQTCGGSGVPSVCGCQPTTCAARGKDCGTIPDGCGGTLACGGCSDGSTCGGGGDPNVCGSGTGTCGNGAVDPGEDCDGGACCDTTCHFASETLVCRPAAGPCDAPETCTGASALCPSDLLEPAGNICRTAQGPCDLDEVCSGSSPSCPEEVWRSSAEICRSAEGVCDVDETCSGAGPLCPEDGFRSTTFLCRAAQGACDAPESCTGTHPACPDDAPSPDGTECSDQDACTVADSCQGGACVPGFPLVCEDQSPCTVDTCDPGTGCEFSPVALGTPCLDADRCNGSESCDGMGTCLAGAPLLVDDGDACTRDECDPISGVSHAPLAVGAPCGPNGAACDAFGECTPPLPPDPSTLATPVDPTVATGLFESLRFLFEGPNAIQTGVAADAISDQRVALIRGRVVSRDGTPLPGVRVSVHDHPELGETITRADGAFDIVVNGGGKVTLRYERTGFLTADRRLDVAWQGFVRAPDVALVTLDPAVTTVSLPSSSMQEASGTVTTDSDGTRQATLFFEADTEARLSFADGTVSPIASLSVRATEYTVGPLGPAAMPASLPTNTAYTYAVELSADEALSARATSVEFSRPVPLYVDNFLSFPVGTKVPAGWYDPARASWVPIDDGIVARIVGVSNGVALLDTDGDGASDGETRLQTLGITASERSQLFTKHGTSGVGRSFWRVPVSHFTAFDLNWGYREEGLPPVPMPPDVDADDDDCAECGGSIRAENQSVGQAIGLAGTPFQLVYQTERETGRSAGRTLEIPITGDSVPSQLSSVVAQIEVEGRAFEEKFAALPNQRYTFAWDGLDAYGRPIVGRRSAQIRLFYQYPGLYAQPAATARSFALFPGLPISGAHTRDESAVVQQWSAGVGVFDTSSQGIGHWMIDSHHAYDPFDQTLYLGNGQRRSARNSAPTMTRYAGIAGGGPHTYAAGVSLPDGSARDLRIQDPRGLAIDASGALYFPDSIDHCVWRVDRNGHRTRLAGVTPQSAGYNGDGISALSAKLNGPIGIALDRRGNIYVADTLNHRIRRIDAQTGIITTIVGTGAAGYNGEGLLATATQVNAPEQMAMDAEDNLYWAEPRLHRVRKLSVDGHVYTVAGNGTQGFSGDGSTATSAQLSGAKGIAVAPNGELYIADTGNGRVRKVGINGVIRTVAGRALSFHSDCLLYDVFRGCQRWRLEEGVLALSALLQLPTGVGVDHQGSIFITDTMFAEKASARLRVVGLDGRIRTLAGGGPNAFSDGPALTAQLYDPTGVVVGPEGDVFVASTEMHVVLRIGRVFSSYRGRQASYVIPSEDAGQIFMFDTAGRHLSTVDAWTGADVLAFAYDQGGRLASMTDADGRTTLIEREGGGRPVAIVSPDGERTALSINADGRLERVSDPSGASFSFEYSSAGLLVATVEPTGARHEFAYDAAGRLVRGTNPQGGSLVLSGTRSAFSHEVALTSAAGRVERYRQERLPTGSVRRTSTDSAGVVRTVTQGADGCTTVSSPDGTSATECGDADSRFGMQAPNTRATVTTPQGLVSTLNTSREVVLSNPSDPTSVQTLTETMVLNGRRFEKRYDAVAHTLRMTTPSGRRGLITVDNDFRVSRAEPPGRDPISYSYDAMGRPQSISTGSGPDARQTILSYDARGNVASVTDTLGHTTEYLYDSAGRTRRVTMPGGEILAIERDTMGRITSIAPPGRPAYLFEYRPDGLPARETAPDVGDGPSVRTYAYDADGQLTEVTLPDGEVISLSHDGAGRMLNLSHPDGTKSFTYDSSGRLSSLSQGGVVLSMTYEGALVRSESWSGPVAGAVSRTYNGDLLPVSETVSAAGSAYGIAFGYDQDGMLVSAGSATMTRQTASGEVSGVALGALTKATTYNGFGELAETAATVSGVEIFRETLTRDRSGRIVQANTSILGETHVDQIEYDASGRLVRVLRDGAVFRTYAYDENGNRISRSDDASTVMSSYDLRDRLETSGPTSYAYTGEGFLASATDASGTTQYHSDRMGGLRSVVFPEGSRIDYAVDPLGRRIQKRRDGAFVQAFLYRNSLQPAAELDGSGQLVSRFVYGSRTNVPEYFTKNGRTYSIVSDHLGSPRLIVDVSDGAIAQRMDYDPFGVVLLDTNPGFQPFGFSGGLWDPDTSLVRLGAREYDPANGRWTSPDPILFEGGESNLYAYAGNNPIGFIDPNGLSALTVAGDVAAGYGDVLSLGATWLIRSAVNYAFDLPDTVNYRSNCYFIGQKAGFATSLALGGGAALLRPFTSAAQTVTTWTSAGKAASGVLKPGSWVMTGSNSYRNYLFTGTVRYNKYANSITTTVPGSALRWPPGREFLKGLLGQRIYAP